MLIRLCYEFLNTLTVTDECLWRTRICLYWNELFYQFWWLFLKGMAVRILMKFHLFSWGPAQWVRKGLIHVHFVGASHSQYRGDTPGCKIPPNQSSLRLSCAYHSWGDHKAKHFGCFLNALLTARLSRVRTTWALQARYDFLKSQKYWCLGDCTAPSPAGHIQKWYL